MMSIHSSVQYSRKLPKLIDEEVKRMVNEQYERAKQILSEHKEQHNELAQLLIDKEVIFAEDVERILETILGLLVRRKS